jgi:hypothetical protein
MKPPLKIHVFIISWTGAHDNSIQIANNLKTSVDRVTIVYSDKDPSLRIAGNYETCLVHNGLFWGGKFAACLALFDADIFLQIQGDCKCEDWGALVARCRASFDAFPIIGVWSPKVFYTDITLEMTLLGALEKDSLFLVTCTDGLVFAFTKPIVTRMKQLDYKKNRFGWGIERAVSACAYLTGRVAVLDKTVDVKHEKGRGYDSREATQQYFEFLNQLTLHERILINLAASHMQMQLLKTKQQQDACS